MPIRFWATTSPPDPGWRGIAWRPPSSSLLIMHQNMQRVWFMAFIPATIATGLALVLMAWAAIIQQIADNLGSVEKAHYCFLGVVAALFCVLVVWLRWARPILGAQD